MDRNGGYFNYSVCYYLVRLRITSVPDVFQVGTTIYGKPLSFSRLVHPPGCVRSI